ncbi:MAG: M48 family metalloprotease [Pseudomonadota bacterium]
MVATAALAALAPQSGGGQSLDVNRIIGQAKSIKKVGDSFRRISEPQEIKIGGDLAGMMMGAAPLIDDPVKQRYVNELGRWLALHSERPGLPWKFGIIDSADFNAFSMPGGYVLITSGLLDRMRSESELAGVLAHEIAHVVRRHHIEALQKGLRSAAVGDMQQYFNVGGSGVGGAFAKALLSAGRALYIRGLDKEDEFEADRMGVIIAARSGYSPYGLIGVLQTLSGAPATREYALDMKTHPSPLDRIQRLDAAMGTKLDGLSGLADDELSFQALYAPPPTAAPTTAPTARPTPRPRRKRR